MKRTQSMRENEPVKEEPPTKHQKRAQQGDGGDDEVKDEDANIDVGVKDEADPVDVKADDDDHVDPVLDDEGCPT